MLIIANETEIIARGGSVYGDDDFTIVACESCGCQYLYNSEVLQLYFDPFDLSSKFLEIEGADIPSCRSCGTEQWTYKTLGLDEMAQIKSGPWAWVLEG